MADEKVYTSKDGALWYQRAPADPPQYLGCYDLDDISADKGGISLIQCFDVNGQYRTRGFIDEAPSPITTSLTTWLGKTAEFLESMNCEWILHVNLRCSGKADVFSNYDRAVVLKVAKTTNRTLKNLVKRKEPAEAEQTFDISILPPFIDVYTLTVLRQGISETRAANSIFFLDAENCPSDCSIAHLLGDIGILGTDAAASAEANVFLTEDGGQTWTATVAFPFAANQLIADVAGIYIGRDTIRWFAVRGVTDAGNPAELAYTDDDGATWSNVDVGAVNGQFCANKKTIVAIDEFNIWVATSGGYIYKSETGGVTWEAQHAGTLTTQNLHVIRFKKGSRQIGWAGGASNALLRTIDGGQTWSLVTGPQPGQIIHALEVIDSNHVWVGYDDGTWWYTRDAGDNWDEMTFRDEGTGDVRDVMFVDDIIGYMIHNTADPIGTIYFTRNGGASWEPKSTPTNAGLNCVSVLKSNLAYACGEASGGSPVVLKVS